MRWLAVTGVLTLVFLGVCTMIAQGPDRELHFSREVPLKTSAATAGLAIDHLKAWPLWFYSLTSVEILDANGMPVPASAGGGAGVVAGPQDPLLSAGHRLRFMIDPHKGPWRKSELIGDIASYVPGKSFRIVIVSDSKHKLTQLFDHLEWTVEIVTNAQGKSLVRGSATAHTSHWRSRLFGVVAEKILLHQAFYPNLIALSELTDPFPKTVAPLEMSLGF